jgi:hypothetical protein
MAGDIGYILAIDGFVYVHSGILFSGNAQLELEKLKAQAENAAISRKKSMPNQTQAVKQFNAHDAFSPEGTSKSHRIE